MDGNPRLIALLLVLMNSNSRQRFKFHTRHRRVRDKAALACIRPRSHGRVAELAETVVNQKALAEAAEYTLQKTYALFLIRAGHPC